MESQARVRPTLLLQDVDASRRHGRGKSAYTAALRDLILLVTPGESVGILGSRRDGAGLIAELVGGSKDPEKGKIYIDGDPVVLDAPGAFIPEETLRFNMVRFAMAHGMSGQRVRSAVAIVAREADVEEAMLGDSVENLDHVLVERMRFYLALATGTKVLVVDESEALNEVLQNEAEQTKLSTFYSRGGSLIVITSDIRQLGRMTGRVCWLHQGKLIMDDEPASVQRWRRQLSAAESSGDSKKAAQLIRRFQNKYKAPLLSLRGRPRRRAS